MIHTYTSYDDETLEAERIRLNILSAKHFQRKKYRAASLLARNADDMYREQRVRKIIKQFNGMEIFDYRRVMIIKEMAARDITMPKEILQRDIAWLEARAKLFAKEGHADLEKMCKDWAKEVRMILQNRVEHVNGKSYITATGNVLKLVDCGVIAGGKA